MEIRTKYARASSGERRSASREGRREEAERIGDRVDYPRGMNCGFCGRIHRAEASFCDQCGSPLAGASASSPRAYTPAHRAERILTSRSALEGER